MASAETIYDRAFAMRSLTEAWESILDRGDAEERLADSVARFRQQADEKLMILHEELATCSYRPGPLHEVLMPKDDGEFRSLAVPPVRDRIVERALLSAITPFVDCWLGPSSYAYRPGIGVADAVQEVARLRDEGHHWVLRADIEDCFPSIPRGRAVRMLTSLLPDATVDDLVRILAERRVFTRRGIRETTGLSQGVSLSPMMANLMLTHLDNALLDRGFPLVRYADDFTVVCRSPEEAWEAARTASAALEELNMTLSSDKTEIMSFDDGFCFLGEDFGPRYPPLLERHRVADPLRRVVYVARQGARLFKSEGRLIVESADDEQLMHAPISHVSRIVCFGSVGVSAGLRSWALEHAVDVVFLSRRGNYLGQQLAASDATRVDRITAQMRVLTDPARRLGFGRAVVEAKIRHQVTLVQRYNSPEIADDIVACIHQMKSMSRMICDAKNHDELLGLEGAAARSYFRALSLLLPAELAFSGRNRQPPLDVVNAALSYGYAVLLSECVSALVAAGLDPGFGLLHTPQDTRASLALDLIEEFRPMIVDQAVIGLARRRRLTVEHGQRRDGESGVFLTKAGKEILTDAYERRMLQVTSGALEKVSGSLRRHVYRQAERLAAFVASDTETWTGLSWR